MGLFDDHPEPESPLALPAEPSQPPQLPHVPGPLGIFATVGAAVRLYGADLVKLLQVMAIVVIPVQVLLFILRDITLPAQSQVFQGELYVVRGTDSGFVAVTSLGYLLTALIMLVSTGAAYRILLGRHLHHPAGVLTSFSFATERVASLLWVSILTGIFVVIGFICLIIPGIFLAVSLSIAVPVVMAEHVGGFAALRRSQQLVDGRWWHVLGCIVVALIPAAIGEAAITLALKPLVKALSPHSSAGFLIIGGGLNAIVAIIVSPFSAAVFVVIYVDMLLRRNDPHLPRLLA